ncbi:MAG: flagellar motor switch protein FliN [Planctomycetota bacterium]
MAEDDTQHPDAEQPNPSEPEQPEAGADDGESTPTPKDEADAASAAADEAMAEMLEATQAAVDGASAEDANATPKEEADAASAAADEAMAAMLAATQAAVNAASGDGNAGGAEASSVSSAEGATPFDLPGFSSQTTGAQSEGIDLLNDVNLRVRIELGRTKMFVEDVLRLNDGCVIELDKLAGDPVDVYVNDRCVARGEVLVLNDQFCVRISDIVDPDVVEAMGGNDAA